MKNRWVAAVGRWSDAEIGDSVRNDAHALVGDEANKASLRLSPRTTTRVLPRSADLMIARIHAGWAS